MPSRKAAVENRYRSGRCGHPYGRQIGRTSKYRRPLWEKDRSTHLTLSGNTGIHCRAVLSAMPTASSSAMESNTAVSRPPQLRHSVEGTQLDVGDRVLGQREHLEFLEHLKVPKPEEVAREHNDCVPLQPELLQVRQHTDRACLDPRDHVVREIQLAQARKVVPVAQRHYLDVVPRQIQRLESLQPAQRPCRQACDGAFREPKLHAVALTPAALAQERVGRQGEETATAVLRVLNIQPRPLRKVHVELAVVAVGDIPRRVEGRPALSVVNGNQQADAALAGVLLHDVGDIKHDEALHMVQCDGVAAVRLLHGRGPRAVGDVYGHDLEDIVRSARDVDLGNVG
eukprot:480228-Rhodomonas_salina.2